MNNYLKLGLAAAVGVGAALLYKKLTCPCSHAASSPAVTAAVAAVPASDLDDDKDADDGAMSVLGDGGSSFAMASTPTSLCSSCTSSSSNLVTEPIIDLAPSARDYTLSMSRLGMR